MNILGIQKTGDILKLERMSNLNNKIQKINELHKGDFISLYDIEKKN